MNVTWSTQASRKKAENSSSPASERFASPVQIAAPWLVCGLQSCLVGLLLSGEAAGHRPKARADVQFV